MPWHSVNLPHGGDVHLLQFTQITSIIRQCSGVCGWRASIAGSGAAVGQQRTSRTMNTRPTIRAPVGYRMTLILGKDLGREPISRRTLDLWHAAVMPVIRQCIRLISHLPYRGCCCTLRTQRMSGEAIQALFHGGSALSRGIDVYGHTWANHAE